MQKFGLKLTSFTPHRCVYTEALGSDEQTSRTPLIEAGGRGLTSPPMGRESKLTVGENGAFDVSAAYASLQALLHSRDSHYQWGA